LQTVDKVGIDLMLSPSPEFSTGYYIGNYIKQSFISALAPLRCQHMV